MRRAFGRRIEASFYNARVYQGPVPLSVACALVSIWIDWSLQIFGCSSILVLVLMLKSRNQAYLNQIHKAQASIHPWIHISSSEKTRRIIPPRYVRDHHASASAVRAHHLSIDPFFTYPSIPHLVNSFYLAIARQFNPQQAPSPPGPARCGWCWCDPCRPSIPGHR